MSELLFYLFFFLVLLGIVIAAIPGLVIEPLCTLWFGITLLFPLKGDTKDPNVK